MTLVQSELKKIYIRVEAQPITTAGIYHNPEQWLISLSKDWTNWITIADKNLWATEVYTYNTTITENNAWKFYQWGNNYGFAWAWSVTTSSTQVNASTYWPWNYYSGSTFITYDGDWSNVQNDNLRWDTTDTVAARQWPCPSGFHVPSAADWAALFAIGSNTDGWLAIWTTSFWSNASKYLKIPYWWYRRTSNGSIVSRDTSSSWQWWYISSSPYYEEAMYSWIWQNYFRAYSSSSQKRAVGALLRPFANTPVQPDESRTVLYPTS